MTKNKWVVAAHDVDVDVAIAAVRFSETRTKT